MRAKIVVVATALLVMLVAVGCTSSDDTTSTTSTSVSTSTSPDPFGCISAPVEQRHSQSEFPFAIADNPAKAGSTTVLRLGDAETVDPERRSLGEDSITGYAARWECWTGTEWVNTHLLVYNGETTGGDPNTTTTWLDLGRGVPDAFDVAIPEVRPGWYRIEARITGPEPYGSENFERLGYVAVEVVE